MLTDQLPPHDVEAEEAVLASILIDEGIISQIDLIPDDFFTSQCKWIYEAMLNLNGEVDQITVAHELARQGKLEEIGGASYLSQIISQIPTSLHAEDYARIVKKCALNRKLISAGNKILSMGFENSDPQENLAQARDLLGQINEFVPQREASTAKELARLANDHYGTLRNNCPGLLTGISNIDNKLGGLLPGESVVSCANTSVGKTTLAVQIAHNVSKFKWVLFASEEMTEQDIINKLVAQISGVRTELITLGNYPDERLDKLIQALAEVAELKLRITKCRTTARLRSQIEKYQPSLVIVDYLQKLRDQAGKDETPRLSFIAHELTSMAKEYKIPLITLSQLHRNMEDKKNKKPRLGDIRGSGEIEESFDMVWGLWRSSYTAFLDGEEAEEKETTELRVLKNRLRGNTGKVTLYWDKANEKYQNLPGQSE